MSSVGFSIEGEFITEHFRTRVREGDWRDALKGFKESFTSMNDEYAYSILSGEGKLVGVNQVYYEQDDVYTDKEWLKKQYYSYFNNVIRIDKKFYKPYAHVTSLNESDCIKAMENNDFYSLPVNSGNNDFALAFNRMRAETYCDRATDKVILSKLNNCWVLVKEVTVDFPIWLTNEEVDNLLNESLIENYNINQKDIEELETLSDKLTLNQIKTNNFASTLGLPPSDDLLDHFLSNLNESDNFEENIEDYKDKIEKQAELYGGWLTLKDTKNNKEYTIPRNPFYRWCLVNNSAYNSIEWSCVSPRSVKMASDDPNHTDWFIFTGLSLENSYESKENASANAFFSKMRNKYLKKLTNFDFVTLTNKSNHKGFKKAQIVHINTPEEIYKISAKQVVLIPEASPDFEMVAHKCAKNNCILITEIGGKLCHLAIVGREFKLTLLSFDKAFDKLPENFYCSVDFEKGIIETLDEDMETLMQQKISGKRYN